MKNIIIFLAFFGSSTMFSQNIMHIDWCKSVGNEIYKLSIVHNNDTLLIPMVDDEKYLSPVKYYGLNCDWKDTTYMTLLVENSRMYYSIPVAAKDLLCQNLKFCIEENKFSKKARWSLLNCGAVGAVGFTKGKKKRHIRVGDKKNEIINGW